jgi:hypothetical protein
MTFPDDEPDDMFGIGPGVEPRVKVVVSALTAPATPEELADEREAIATAVRLCGIDAEWQQLTSMPGRSTMRSSRRKIIVPLAASIVLGTAGLAMARALPGPAQDAVSNVFDRLGITVPPSEDRPDAATLPSDENTADTTAPASTGEEIAGLATTTDAAGVAKGAVISSTASGGMSRAGQAGAQSEPPVAAGPETGATASGGASTARSGNASQHATP